MSARVLNPVVLTELYKLRSPSSVRRNFSHSRKINGIKKDLFGPTNPSETRKIFDDELEKHQDVACKKWSFDFRNGYPVVGGQYIWEQMTFSDFIPEMYTLSRAAHLREIPIVEPSLDDILLDERAAKQNVSSVIDDPFLQGEVIFKLPSADSELALKSLKKRQPKITEYMKERKRLAPAAKKSSPAKRMRTLFSASSSVRIQRN